MAKKKIPPLVVEDIKDLANLYYLSLIEYKRENYLVVIDNISDYEISAYVLDYAEQEGVDIKQFLSIVNHWFYKSANKYPLSFELARIGVLDRLSPIFRTFDIGFISRVIGHPFKFDLNTKTKIKRRKVVPPPSSVEVRFKR